MNGQRTIHVRTSTCLQLGVRTFIVVLCIRYCARCGAATVLRVFVFSHRPTNSKTLARRAHMELLWQIIGTYASSSLEHSQACMCATMHVLHILLVQASHSTIAGSLKQSAHNVLGSPWSSWACVLAQHIRQNFEGGGQRLHSFCARCLQHTVHRMSFTVIAEQGLAGTGCTRGLNHSIAGMGYSLRVQTVLRSNYSITVNLCRLAL